MKDAKHRLHGDWRSADKRWLEESYGDAYTSYIADWFSEQLRLRINFPEEYYYLNIAPLTPAELHQLPGKKPAEPAAAPCTRKNQKLFYLCVEKHVFVVFIDIQGLFFHFVLLQSLQQLVRLQNILTFSKYLIFHDFGWVFFQYFFVSIMVGTKCPEGENPVKEGDEDKGCCSNSSCLIQ